MHNFISGFENKHLIDTGLLLNQHIIIVLFAGFDKHSSLFGCDLWFHLSVYIFVAIFISVSTAARRARQLSTLVYEKHTQPQTSACWALVNSSDKLMNCIAFQDNVRGIRKQPSCVTYGDGLVDLEGHTPYHSHSYTGRLIYGKPKWHLFRI